MALNYVWIFFFLVAFVVATCKLIFLGDVEVFTRIMDSTFAMSKTSVNISIALVGVMTLWLGIMKIGEDGGAIRILSKIVGPFFNKLFPELPKNHPATGSMLMNFSANMLGLDNAATPLGLKAMNQLQEVNPNKDTASNAQIMFLVLNTSGLTIVPVSVMAVRAAQGSVTPSDIFLPILLATFCSSIVGLVAVSIVQKINLFDKTILAYLGTAFALVGCLIWYVTGLSPENLKTFSSLAGNLILFSIIVSFIALAIKSKVNVYNSFIDGAKDGFAIAIKIIPYLLAMLVGIGVFRASGALDYIESALLYLGMNEDIVHSLPTAMMKPLSGSGARGMMIEAMDTYGVDSFVGKLTSIFQGSTETTFYTLAIYYGAIGVKNTRYTVTCGLIADAAGITAAIFIAYLFFG